MNTDFFRDLDWIFDVPEGGKVRRYPLTDLGIDSKGNLIVRLAIAGFGPNDVEISASGNELIIEGSLESKDSEVEYFQKHISSEDFKRVVRLNDEFIGGEIDASYKNGVLIIKVLKAEKPKKLIEIKVA
jgi:HSP20 family molecular chaperone IbpA